MPVPPVATPARSSALDGLRGIAIVLVVLSHSWKVWPLEDRGSLGPLSALFNSGSVAVSVLFVISGFLVTRALLRARQEFGILGPLHWFVKRFLRISLQLWLLLFAVWLMARYDSTDPSPEAVTRTSLVEAATYTWNTYVRDHALEARSDIGAVYFLAIDLQFFAAFLLVVLVLARWPRVLTGVLAVAVVMATAWRWQVMEASGWFVATLTTTSRMDALLWGCLVAMVASGFAAVRPQATPLLGAGLLLVLAAVGSTAFYGIEWYFGVQGVVAAGATAVLVWADHQERLRTSMADELLSAAPLAALGAASLTIFLWHIPIFEAVARHLPAAHPLIRSLVALGILAVVVVIVERLVARPLQRLARRLTPRRPAQEALAAVETPLSPA